MATLCILVIVDHFILFCGFWRGSPSGSREAMVPMKQPSGYALRAARMKTACSRAPRAMDRGGHHPGEWGQGGLAPIGVNLPDGCNAFSVIPASQAIGEFSSMPKAVLFP